MKKIILVIIAFITVFSFTITSYAQKYKSTIILEKYANETLLSNPYKVYTNGIIILNHPYFGFFEKNLPTINDFKGKPGCYVACYSKSKKGSVYHVGNDIFVMGQVRVPGEYVKGVCVPTGFAGKDISANDQFKQLCQSKIKACSQGDCWAGGATGGWFGLKK